MNAKYTASRINAYHRRQARMQEDPKCYSEQLRPQFHFTPLFNWCNDPNGLVYYDGEYHLFFQHNPFGRKWGNTSWGHAVSTDLLRWKQLPIALWPDELGTIWSGSGVVDTNNTAGFQTGKESPIVVVFTYAGQYAKIDQPFTQAIAYSNDRGRTWIKYECNPTLPNQSGGRDRDPKIIWHKPTQKWVMVLFLDSDNKLGFFTSTDLKKWSCTSEIQGFYECPDLFELPVDGNRDDARWILMGADGEYLIGQFNGQTFETESGKHASDRGSNFYAPQTFSDIPEDDGRRIQIAWMDGGKYPGMPFNQQMSFPCELTLRAFPEGIRLCRYPIREIEKLYSHTVTISDQNLNPGHNPLEGISSDLLDIQLEIEPGQATEVSLQMSNFKIRYNAINRNLSMNDATVPLSTVFNTLKLRALVDRTSIEVFGNDGRVSMSSCYLPIRSAPKNLNLSVQGGTARVISLIVHQLKSIWQ